MNENVHSNLAAGAAHQEVTWAFYYWCHLNIADNPQLQEVDRILLGGKTFEERYRRPVKGRQEPDEPPPPPPPPPPTNARPPINNFIGRKRELERIDVFLTGGSKAAAIVQSKAGKIAAAVRGLGGVGKSSLARQYADDHRRDYAGIWWCNAEEQTTFLPDLHKLAEFLHIDRGKQSDVQWAINAVHGLSGRDDMHLLIYDNVENPQTIKDFMPGSYARLLITSRFHNWRGHAEIVELDVLPLEDAVRLLKECAPSVDATGAEFLAETLGRLPLALDHAAAYCESRKLSFADYAKEVAELIAEDSPARDYPRSVKVTFDMAIRRAVELCPEAETLITYMAYCAPDQIPDILVEGSIPDAKKRGDAIQALRQLSLIKDDPIKVQLPSDKESSSKDGQESEDAQLPEGADAPKTIPAWSVHRLVQQVARARSAESRASMLTKIGLHLNRVFPTTGYDKTKDWPVCKALMPHVWPIYAFDEENPGNGDFSTIFDLAGLYLLGSANMQAAGNFLRRSLAIRQNLPSVTARELSKAFSDLALFFDTDGKLAEAEKLCQKALTIRQEKFGMLDEETIISLNNLAYIYMNRNKLPRSYRMFKESLKYTKKYFGENDLETATAWDNLSNCSRRRGRFEEALDFCKKGIAIKLSKGDEGEEALATSYESLAAIEYDLDRKDEAYDHYAEAERLAVKYYTSESFAANEVRMGMARILIERKEFEKAREKFALVLTATTKSCGAGDDENGRVREQYALILIETGNSVEARPILQEAIEIFRANTPKRSPDVRRCMKVLRQLDAASD